MTSKGFNTDGLLPLWFSAETFWAPEVSALKCSGKGKHSLFSRLGSLFYSIFNENGFYMNNTYCFCCYIRVMLQNRRFRWCIKIFFFLFLVPRNEVACIFFICNIMKKECYGLCQVFSVPKRLGANTFRHQSISVSKRLLILTYSRSVQTRIAGAFYHFRLKPQRVIIYIT